MKVFLIGLFCFFMISVVCAQESNYCHDEQSWKDWDALVLKYPNDKGVQMLHAVRIGLCRKIENGTISFEVAQDAFNQMHEIAIERAKQERKHYLENRKL